MTWPLFYNSVIMANDETLTIVRQPQSVNDGVTYVGGKAVHSQAQILVFVVACNVQPVAGDDDLLIMPEGERIDDQFWLYTQDVTPPIDAGDLTMRSGKTYQCQASEDWGDYVRARFVADQSLEALS